MEWRSREVCFLNWVAALSPLLTLMPYILEVIRVIWIWLRSRLSSRVTSLPRPFRPIRPLRLRFDQFAHYASASTDSPATPPLRPIRLRRLRFDRFACDASASTDSPATPPLRPIRLRRLRFDRFACDASASTDSPATPPLRPIRLRRLRFGRYSLQRLSASAGIPCNASASADSPRFGGNSGVFLWATIVNNNYSLKAINKHDRRIYILDTTKDLVSLDTHNKQFGPECQTVVFLRRPFACIH